MSLLHITLEKQTNICKYIRFFEMEKQHQFVYRLIFLLKEAVNVNGFYSTPLIHRIYPLARIEIHSIGSTKTRLSSIHNFLGKKN